MRKIGRSLMILVALAAGTVGAGTLGPTGLRAPIPETNPKPRMYCGGEPGGDVCPAGFVCVDVPGDQCNPRHQTDCLGYCKLPKR